jgi:hypothetical protein
LLLDDRVARALEAAALSKKADDSPYRAILGPVAKRIEKKLTPSRSGNSRSATKGEPEGTTWIVTDGSVGIEAEGIAARGELTLSG